MSSFPFILLLILLTIPTTPTTSQTLPQTQTKTMLSLSNLTLPPLWNPNKQPNPCKWSGVLCSTSSSSAAVVIGLSFPPSSVSGPQALSLSCTLSSLQNLDFSNNPINPTSPTLISKCGSLPNLKSLNMSNTSFSGPLPSFTGFPTLQSLELSRNLLSGPIESQFDSLLNIQSLNLSFNSFSGPIPTSLNLGLRELRLSNNYFTGSLPKQLFSCSNLTILDLSSNSLSGFIPDEFASLPALEMLLLSSNHFSGAIPQSVSALKNLSWFGANQNNFTGPIPIGIMKNLSTLDLSFNNLSGPLPADLLSSPSLKSVDLTSNELIGSIPQNMSWTLFRVRLGDNRLTGAIPPSVGEVLGLQSLELDDNRLEGAIPTSLRNCTKLTLLNLANNSLQGDVPRELGELQLLVVLQLQMNRFNGLIPDELFQLKNLLNLNISRNALTGPIPSRITGLQTLQTLSLEENSLSGSIPASIGGLKNLIELSLGANELSGDIPRLPVSLSTALNLSSNKFDGPIPQSFNELTNLEVLDISNNGFTGDVPTFLTRMGSLTTLDLSNNNLSGTLPTFPKYVRVNATGNEHLKLSSKGGSIDDHRSSAKRKTSLVPVIVGTIVGAILVVGALFAGFLWLASKRFNQVEDESHLAEVAEPPPPPKITDGRFLTTNTLHRSNIDFERAMEAVADPTNIVAKTRFVKYYNAVMPNGASYLVKKLEREFAHAFETLELSKLRNVNIMSALACVRTDDDGAYLLYERTERGTLFEVLHGEGGGLGGGCEGALGWSERCSIAMGVSQGLAYLHGRMSPMVLLDVSSKNVFLKSKREAVVGDIEVCKVIHPSEQCTGSLSTVAGSVGYIPPEYAYTMRVTMEGNVYSFGVILLELLTGKPPLMEGTELAKWALQYSSRPDEQEQILDARVRAESSRAVRSQMLSVLKVALRCVSPSPGARPKMSNVVRLLSV